MSIIIDQYGRPRSVRTEEEQLNQLIEDIGKLDPEEQRAVLELFEDLEGGGSGVYQAVNEVEYEHRPVDIETFLREPYFFGHVGGSMYDQLKDDIVELFNGTYEEGILGGCVDLDALVYGADGSLHTLRERLGTSPWVTSVADTGEEASKSSGAIESGVRPVVQLTLANGASVKLTPDHKVRVWREGYRWVEAEELVEDDLVVVPRKWTPSSVTTISSEEAKLIAYFVGDGSVSETRSRFCDGNPETSQEVLMLLRALGFDGTRYPKGNAWEVHTTKTKTSGFWDWACSHGLDLRTHEVMVPRSVCISSNEVVAAFLNRLWACEGCVYAPSSGKSPPRFTLGMTSERCVRQVQALLLRFGVRGRISEVQPKGRSKLTCWHLQVSGRDQLAAFLDTIGPILGKEGACERIAAYVAKNRGNTNVDVLPVTWGWLNDQMVERGIQRPVGNRWWMLATSRECRVSRQLFARWLGDYGSTELGGELRSLFDDSIGFDRVKSVDEVLVAIPTGDVTDAGESRRFVANGVSVSNSIGWGKSFFATTAMGYVLYQMSCLRDPQRAYGLQSGSFIYLAMLSVTEKVAKRVAIQELISKIQYSPYFKEKFPGKPAPSNLEIKFPKQIQVVGGSTGSSAIIGLNVFSGFIDETSFMGEKNEVDATGGVSVISVGEKIYQSIIRRMKSRFQRSGRLPGVLLVVSSKERPNAFIERRVKQARENDEMNVFVREYATWHVKPSDQFSDETFWVSAGNDRVQSKILGQDPDPAEVERLQEMGLQLVEVPMDYWGDFNRDIDGSLRDIAGIATESISNFIHRIDKVFEGAENHDLVNPISPEAPDQWTWVPGGAPLQIDWHRVAEAFERRLPGGYKEQAWKPRRHPSAPRYVHIDSSLTGDATGVVIEHVSGWTEVTRRGYDGEEYKELAPRVETDLVLRIVPPPGDEIQLSDVRGIVYAFQDHGFHIAYASLDSFQSADTIQQFKKRGINAEIISVDRTTDAYDVTKAAFYEDRLKVLAHPWMLAELRNVQRVQSSRGKVKIDHPNKMTGPNGVTVRGSKDVADALAGATFSITQRIPGRPIAPQLGGSQYGGAVEERPDHSWVTDGKVVQQTSKSGPPEGGRSRVGKAPPDPRGLKMPFTKG